MKTPRFVIPSAAKDPHFRSSAAAAIALIAGAMNLSAQARIPVRQLPAPTASTTEELGSVASVRQLPNGNVLVNDQSRLRVAMFDKDMKLVGVVADSTSSTANAYGVRPGALIPKAGDSTLFIDPASLSMLVIDPTGKIVRTMAAPRPNDLTFMTSPAFGTPGFDSQGRLVYRTRDMSAMMRGMGRGGPEPGKPFVPPAQPDTDALVRFDLGARKLDTVGFFKIPKINMSVSQDANGGMRMTSRMNPLPVVDEWAVMTDGTVAFVRGQDYHIDFVDAKGTVAKTDKIPYDWQRMTDEDKQNFLDSARVAIEKQRAAAAANATPGATPGQTRVVGGGDAGKAIQETGMVMVFSRGADGPAPPQRGGPVGGRGEGPMNITMPPVEMVPINELPDYKPVFGTASVKADMDNRLWVRTIPTKPTPGGAIYEVIDRTGKLVDRVQVPVGSTIAGFGPGNVVYLGVRDDKGALHVQRVSMK